MPWVDVHSIGGFIAPKDLNAATAQLQRAYQLYQRYIDEVVW